MIHPFVLHAGHLVPNLCMVPASGNIVKAFDTLPFLSHLSFLSLKGSVMKRVQLCELQLTIAPTNNSKQGMFNDKIMTSDFLITCSSRSLTLS